MHDRIRNLIFLFFAVCLSHVVIAQCGSGGSYVSDLSMLPSFQTVSTNAGDRFSFDGYDNITYIFSFCQGGGSNSVDTQIEICDQNGTVVFDYNDDHCGLGSEITWNCTANGTYSVVIYQYNCNASGGYAGEMAYRTVTPPNEQDCLGAIPLCFNTYNTTASYSGTGHYWNEIPVYGGAASDDNCPGNCLLGGEVNDVWYTFTVQTSGTVSFVISPNDPSDDYDWAVYDITSSHCVDIATAADALQVSCNFCGTAGDTGPSGASAESCQHGNSCTNFNNVLTVNAGETYVVNVSNWSATQSGYSINFGGTAQIIDNTGPYLESILYAPYCGSSSLTVQFSERIWCTSVQTTDFVITGPDGTYDISDVWSEICLAGAGSTYSDTYYDDVFTLELSDYLMHDGDYTISVNAGGVDDICSNYAPSSSLNFTISGINATETLISDIDCYGDTDGSVSLSVSGGTPPYSYLWSNGETGSTATGLQGGLSGVTISDSYGTCQDTLIVSLNDPDPIIVDAGPPVSLCAEGSSTLGGFPAASDGTPPYTYSWSPASGLDDPTSSNPTASPVSTTTYVLEVTDASGCSYSDTVLVTMDPPMTLTFTSTDALCFGEASGEVSLAVSGGTAPYTYEWSNGLGSAATATGLSAGTNYTVSVTDDVNCVETGTVTVGQPDVLEVSFDITDAECGFADGELSANVSGGMVPYTFEWTGGESTSFIAALTPGDYDLTITDGNACTLEESATVGHYGDNEVNIQQLSEIECYGEYSGSLQAEMPDGTAPFEYAWSGSSSTTEIASYLSAGDYSVTVTDVYGCPGNESYTIEQPSVLGVNVLPVDVLCTGGNDGEAEAFVNGGVEPYELSWSTGAVGNNIQDLIPGNYSVTATDQNGCSVSQSFVISEPVTSVQVYVTTESVSCAGEGSGSAIATASGGSSPYLYVWYESGFAIGSGSQIAGLTEGSYYVIAEDDNGCSDQWNFSMTEPAPLTIESAVQQASCMEYSDGQAAVSVIGGTYPYEYQWSTGDTLAAVANLHEGNYYLTVTDGNDCIRILNLYVPENPILCLRIPDAFTPNGDGVNDTWIIEYIDNYPQAQIFVFNRWGQKVYEGGYMDDPWNGTFKGERLPSGSYTYVIDLHNDIYPYSGVVLLVH